MSGRSYISSPCAALVDENAYCTVVEVTNGLSSYSKKEWQALRGAEHIRSICAQTPTIDTAVLFYRNPQAVSESPLVDYTLQFHPHTDPKQALSALKDAERMSPHGWKKAAAKFIETGLTDDQTLDDLFFPDDESLALLRQTYGNRVPKDLRDYHAFISPVKGPLLERLGRSVILPHLSDATILVRHFYSCTDEDGVMLRPDIDLVIIADPSETRAALENPDLFVQHHAPVYHPHSEY